MTLSSLRGFDESTNYSMEYLGSTVEVFIPDIIISGPLCSPLFWPTYVYMNLPDFLPVSLCCRLLPS